MNFDKSKVVWFGCEEPPNITYLNHLNFEWNPKFFTLLEIVHLLISVPTHSQKAIKEINTLLYKFLWNNKPEKIKHSMSSLHLLEGGVDMLDLKMLDQALN